MAYFVTGATGFIGRFLVENLLKRGEPVFALVRKGSQKKLADLRESEGRLGTVVFITAETSYTNQHGVVCAIQRSTGIRY